MSVALMASGSVSADGMASGLASMAKTERSVERHVKAALRGCWCNNAARKHQYQSVNSSDNGIEKRSMTYQRANGGVILLLFGDDSIAIESLEGIEPASIT